MEVGRVKGLTTASCWSPPRSSGRTAGELRSSVRVPSSPWASMFGMPPTYSAKGRRHALGVPSVWIRHPRVGDPFGTWIVTPRARPRACARRPRR